MKKFEYKYVIVIICFLMIFVCLGSCSSCKSIYLVPVTKALGFTRSAYSVTDSIRFVTNAIVNMFFGALISRFGTKKLMLAGMVCVTLSTACYAFSTSLMGYYIGGMLFGLGLSWSSTTMVGSIINKWFLKNTGTVIGIVNAASGIGGAVSSMLLTPLIYDENNVFGYRNAYIATMVFLIIVTAVILLFYKEKKDDIKADAGITDNIIGDSVKTVSRFLYTSVILCIFLSSFSLQALISVSTAHMSDSGIESEYLSMLVSINLIGLAISKIILGIVRDRFGIKLATGFCHVTTALALIALIFIGKYVFQNTLAFMYALLSAPAMTLETIIVPLLAREFSDKHTYDKTLGIFASVNIFGFAVGLPAINLCYDTYGGYNGIFTILVVVMVFTTIYTQFVLKLNKN